MDDKKLLSEYIKYFGDQPPFPPVQIMETLVEMKKNNTFDDALDKMSPHVDTFRETVENVTGKPMNLENPFFDMDFRESNKTRITLKDSFELLTSKILLCSTNEFIQLFRDMKMKEIEFVVQEHEKHLPEFQSGFTFEYKTDHDEKCYFEIRDIGNKVLELSMMVHFRKGWFSSNMDQHFSILKEFCDQKYNFHNKKEFDNRLICSWDGGELMISIRKLKSKIEQISFVVANKELWDEILRNE